MSVLRGRFGKPVSAAMERISSSLTLDLRMLDEDIDGSIAHATMLGETGILSADEAVRICDGLERVRKELESGAYRPGDELEDIHMAVETRLVELIGDVGKKLHTARSRNDQVATDLRLWLKRRLVELDAALSIHISVLLDRVESDGETLMPGYTHLQRGQPILLGHHLLAHCWALVRDRERVADALRRVDQSPLGACAMAGTVHPIDRDRTAELLGFAGVVENAMDAVAARDHLQEAVAVAAIVMTHLSRMSEELVLWSSSEFSFVRLSDEHSTGSSIMPQKRNPDAAELIRGKAARVYGDLQALLSLVKSLPLAYNRDLQEDRQPLFDALDTLEDCLELSAEVWGALSFHRERFEDELKGDPSLATEIADHLVARGVSFRDAHGVVAKLVRWCEEKGCGLDAIDAATAERFHPDLKTDLSSVLDPRAAAERRSSRGGTASKESRRQVELLRATLT